MPDDYVPEYAKGEILVCYKDGLSFWFAEGIGKVLGFPVSEAWNYGTDVYIHQAPEGREDEAIVKFQEYEQFIEWAERRDPKLESRWKRIEDFKRLLNSIDCEHLSDKQFNYEIDSCIK